MRRLERVCAVALVLVSSVSVPAWGQVHIQLLGGTTETAGRHPFVAGDIGVKLGPFEIDAEAGRMQNILPKGILDLLNQLQRQHGLPVQATASLPANYALLSARLIVPSGWLQPFVAAGAGAVRLQPRLDVTVDGVSLGDVFGLTGFGAQTAPAAAASAGLRLDFDKVFVDGAYRYLGVFSDFRPDLNLSNDRVLIHVQSVYVALGVRF